MPSAATPERSATTMSTATRGDPDLHEHIEKIHEAGLLPRIDQPVNKDAEMHPLVRWQCLGGFDVADTHHARAPSLYSARSMPLECLILSLEFVAPVVTLTS